MAELQKTIIVGVSGPSSSGKTTLARLLRTIFNPPPLNPDHPASGGDTIPRFTSFILHEDDFYKPDDQIPVTTTASGKLVEDWDTIDALNISPLTSTLSYIKEHGKLPSNLKSKEDLNDATDSGVDDETISNLRHSVAERLRGLVGARRQLSVAFVDGFLLYAPPWDSQHPLTPVQRHIDIPLFLPATYSLLKQRREGRTGYVTIGPAPTPEPKPESDNADRPSSQGAGTTDTNNENYDPPQQNFWSDPPGYVDDIVWPRYVEDHAWLLLPESVTPEDPAELKRAVGEGKHVRNDVGVIVAPGEGKAAMLELLCWAVEEVMAGVERAFA